MRGRKQHTVGQDAIIKVRRSKTSLKKGDERFEFYFVCEVGRDIIIGEEDREGNDVRDKVTELQNSGWTY